MSDQQARNLTAQVDAEAERLTLALQEIQHDVHLLSRLPDVREFSARTADASADAESIEAWRNRLADIFTTMLESKPDYEQIRLIGVADDGRELIRVQRVNDRPARTPGTALQAKAHRGYFKDTLALPPGRIHISEISLNREFGGLELPHRPMLRAAVPLFLDDGAKFGLVIINMNFDSFIQRLFQMDGNDYHYYLTNSDGDFLLHPDPARTYGFDLGKRHRIQEAFPELVDASTPATFARRARFRSSTGRVGGIIEARRIHPFVDAPDRFLVLGLSASSETIDASSATIGARVLALTIVLLFVAVGMAFTLAHRLAHPLSLLGTAADRLARNERAEFELSHRSDEIGSLSRSLHHMVASLDEQKSRLEQANGDLEYFARIASHDLREPVRRMAILANLLQMEEHDRVSEEGRGTLQRMRDEGLKMVEQLTDLRTLSRLGQGALHRQPTDIAGLIRERLAAYGEVLEGRRVRMVVEPMPEVLVYRTLVELLYTNLIENALHHTPGDDFELTFTCVQRAEGPTFGVRNSGSTIMGNPDRVFEPFHSTSDGAERVGLGLSICRRIVERHSGRIWVDFDADHVHFAFTLMGDNLDS